MSDADLADLMRRAAQHQMTPAERQATDEADRLGLRPEGVPLTKDDVAKMIYARDGNLAEMEARIKELEADNARLQEEVDALENIVRFAFDFGDETIDFKRLDSEIQEAIDSHPAVKIMAGWAGQIADALIAARQETRDE